MNNFKTAVQNAMAIYMQTSGGLYKSLQEVAASFAESEETRQNIYMLVAMQAKGSQYNPE
jgi:hypothetical protein